MDYLEKAELSASSRQYEAALAFACMDIAKTLREFMIVEMPEPEGEPKLVPIKGGQDDE